MASIENTELTERFDQFYRSYYRERIGELAQRYPNEQRSLHVDWGDLYQFDPDLADDFLAQPDQLREYAEEALRLHDLPVDVSLGQAHVRVRNLGEITDIRDIRAKDVNSLVSVSGIIRKATDVRPKVEEAAFECQRCGTLAYIPQSGAFQEPHECQGCERQGPFTINYDQSTFVDAQKLRIQESPEGLRGGETPQHIDVHIEDDITGRVAPGDHVTVTGALRIEQQQTRNQKSRMFDVHMEGHSLVVEDEEFEDMDITDADKRAIIELSQRDEELYDLMTDSIAPSIYGFEEEKLAMTLQLFAGVTKHLPDETRIRGDLHILLIGDPGTGKCVRGDTNVTLGDGSEVEIRELVESHLEKPIPVDDGIYQSVDFPVPSLGSDGSMTQKRATKVWKREAPEQLYRIRTSAGHEVEVTPSHPLYTQTDGRHTAIKAEDLVEGQFIATPRQIPTQSDDVIDVEYRRSEANNAVRLDLPDEWRPWFARLIGYIIAEGHVVLCEDHSGDIRVTNNDRAILDDVEATLDRLGLEWTEDPPRTSKTAQRVRCTSGEFASFLANLEPAILDRSAKRRVPDAIRRASPDIRRAFLKAYIEAEDSVSTKEREITVSSMSKELLDGVQSLLSTVGIGSQVERRSNGRCRLRISGDDFVSYVDAIGFVAQRKASAARAFEKVPENTNADVVQAIGDELRRTRTALMLSESECGLPRSTYQHHERGDRNPGLSSLRTVVDEFDTRLDELKAHRRAPPPDWANLKHQRQAVNVSQHTIADEIDINQTSISQYERGVVTDGGCVQAASAVVGNRIGDTLAVEPDVERLQELTESDVRWERIESIETVNCDDDWVYDLEVEGTHNYLTNGIVSHNSQLLQYTRHIAPRSVYTSGKGSSAAGLCVTGETLIHTGAGFKQIKDIAEPYHPNPVEVDTSSELDRPVYSFNVETGHTESRRSSHVWRMPEKPCYRIETAHGKDLEGSVNTPVLICGESGLEWKPLSAIEPGDHVAVPRYDDIERATPPLEDYLELTNEKVKLCDESLSFLRDELYSQFGDLRQAASSLGLSEDVIYGHLWNRHVPLEKLEAILAGIGASRSDVDIERVMLRHGDSIRIPDAFDSELMYLIGLVFGGGDIAVSRRGENRGLVRISNSDDDLLEHAADIFKRRFDKQVEIERPPDRVPAIRLHNATIARFFRNVGMCSPKVDLRLDAPLTTAEHADAFVRGYMDADGSVSSQTTGGSSVLTSTTSEAFAKQLQLMLETYGIRSRRRERDPRGTHELDSGTTIESKHARHFVELYGTNVERYAKAIGVRSEEKATALDGLIGEATRREEMVPGAAALATAGGPSGRFWGNRKRGDDPGRSRVRSILEERDLEDVAPTVEEVVDADLRWDEVVATAETGRKEVFDLSVPGTHNFIGNGMVTHNTAAAVQDDFGEGQQWTLEAGALVLADMGIAAVDEIDKMRPEDRSAMHEALEQQSISISKAGINSTLKARCALLGAANPKYGRFDQYESIAEQIDLEPALISRFDLIFTVTDNPDESRDAELADHILETNYAGELNTQLTELASPSVTDDDVTAAAAGVEPAIEPELLRKYIAYAKRNVFPSMTDEARAAIREFYVDLRARGTGEDSPVPITARKLEALVRLAEASARVRLSDSIELEDAERVIELIRACLKDIGVDPETGQFDADVIETGTSKTQRDRIKSIRALIRELEDEYEDGAPIEEVINRAGEAGINQSKVEHEIEKLRQRGEVYEPATGHLRTT